MRTCTFHLYFFIETTTCDNKTKDKMNCVDVKWKCEEDLECIIKLA